MPTDRQKLIRALFDEYIEMYAARDERLTTRFGENFSGFAGGSDVLVKARSEWIRVMRQDFAQVPGRLGIEMIDFWQQDLSDTVVLASAFFHLHLPVPDYFLARETTRIVVVFQREEGIWKIAHSSLSIPYRLVETGEVYPLKCLQECSKQLETQVEERTRTLEETNRNLELLSNTDGLTGVANRRSFDHLISLEWSRAQRSGASLALVMLDVDHFKHYNDHYGHLAGDDCLRALARGLVQAGRRAGELVARYGGEEFAVLLPDTGRDEAIEAAQRMQEAIWSLALPHAGSAPGMVTFSLGVASLMASTEKSPDDLIQLADTALYQAKDAGRNCIRPAADQP
jgi:diguanylate cyclase (GGDEF)-like protein